MFRVVNKELGMSRTVQVKCNGIYSYVISDPIKFYTRLCGNVEGDFTRDKIDSQLKTEFIDALQPVLGALSETGIRPDQLPARAKEMKQAMNQELSSGWAEERGISIETIALNPITLTDEDMKKINEMEDAATMGGNAFMMGGRMTTATANAMEAAAANEAGAMNGFIGLGMAGNAMGGGFNAASQLYNMGQQQQAARMAENGWTCACGTVNNGKFCSECGAAKPNDSWICACGATNKGKFCSECGAKKPSGEVRIKCDKCGWENDPSAPAPKFCPECGDPINNADIQ